MIHALVLFLTSFFGSCHPNEAHCGFTAHQPTSLLHHLFPSVALVSSVWPPSAYCQHNTLGLMKCSVQNFTLDICVDKEQKLKQGKQSAQLWKPNKPQEQAPKIECAALDQGSGVSQLSHLQKYDSPYPLCCWVR